MNTPEDRVQRRKASLKRARDKYKAANRERLNEQQRQRRRANLATAAARMREYRARRPDVMKAIEARRTRSPEQKARFNRYRREWAKANPDKQREHAHRRSGRKVGRLERGTIRAIGDRQGWLCGICSTDLAASGYHMDHVVPLARGGQHRAENIQLLCPPCNLSKGAKDQEEFLARRRSVAA